MMIKRYSDDSMLIHLEETDEYDVTEDNGVDIWLSKADVDRIAMPVLERMTGMFDNGNYNGQTVRKMLAELRTGGDR